MRKARLLNFTTLYRLGTPFETGAATYPIADSSLSPTDSIEGVSISPFMPGVANPFYGSGTTLAFNLSPNARVYGLGESVGPLNKRGNRYRLYSTDDPVHTPDKENLYGSHPFVLVGPDTPFGFFIDYPSEIFLDIGFTNPNVMEVAIPSKNFDIYFFSPPQSSPAFTECVKEFLLLVGSPYIPPKWAFGYQQSRWSYPDAKSIMEIAARLRQEDIPCDAIYMDIDYMDNFKVFTIDEQKFPDFAAFTSRLRADGFRLIPIIDPGVKIEDGYSVYEEGKHKGFFCTTKDGSLFQAAVWPGLTHLPDFLNPETRHWWGSLCNEFIKM
ncbi:MAG: alpha-glucosidase, partial [Nitrospirae bacterium]|nr:alpha-glucosidase [Nitrospirota bacterium]